MTLFVPFSPPPRLDDSAEAVISAAQSFVEAHEEMLALFRKQATVKTANFADAFDAATDLQQERLSNLRRVLKDLKRGI